METKFSTFCVADLAAIKFQQNELSTKHRWSGIAIDVPFGNLTNFMGT